MPPKKPKNEVVEPELCSVCANHYTPIVRKKLTCPYCAASNCSQCLSTYLLGLVGDPACMHCRVGLSDTYLSTALNKTFIKGPLFKNRQAVLVQRTRTELPMLQEQAQRIRKQRESEAVLKPIQDEIRGLMAGWRTLRTTMWTADRRYYAARSGWARDGAGNVQEFTEARDAARAAFTEANDRIRDLRARLRRERFEIRAREMEAEVLARGGEAAPAAPAAAAEEEERKKFIRRCCRDGCQGFLSTAWKCGLCEWYSCSQCFAVRGEKHDTPHECKKEDLETAELIKKDTKPCPKCGEFISKSQGCDQMWCIVCKTPFSWTSGKIISGGVIHNPHYYEWLNRTGGAMPRNPADVPCGGYPAAYMLVDLRRMSGWMRHSLDDFHRLAMEVQDVSENRYRAYIDQHGSTDINIRFLLGDIDEKRWGQLLASLEKKRKRDREVQDVFAAFRMVAVELINRLQNYRTASGETIRGAPKEEAEAMVQAFAREAHALIEMINSAFKKVGEMTGYSVPYFVPRHFGGRYVENGSPPEDMTTSFSVTSQYFTTRRKNPKEEASDSDSDSDSEEVEEVPSRAAEAAPLPASYQTHTRTQIIDTFADDDDDEMDEEFDPDALSPAETEQLQRAIQESLRVSEQ
jgi:hypothetical protein